MDDNILLPSTQNEEEEYAEVSLRPKFLKEYIGQTKVKESIVPRIYEDIYKEAEFEVVNEKTYKNFVVIRGM